MACANGVKPRKKKIEVQDMDANNSNNNIQKKNNNEHNNG